MIVILSASETLALIKFPIIYASPPAFAKCENLKHKQANTSWCQSYWKVKTWNTNKQTQVDVKVIEKWKPETQTSKHKLTSILLKCEKLKHKQADTSWHQYYWKVKTWNTNKQTQVDIKVI